MIGHHNVGTISVSAKALGLTIPQSLPLSVDEKIE